MFTNSFTIGPTLRKYPTICHKPRNRLLRELKKTILDIQRYYQTPANTHRSPPLNLLVENQVSVLAKYLRITRLSLEN